MIDADVAIDFSVGDAVPVNLPRLAARGLNVVIGTTGWQARVDVREGLARTVEWYRRERA